MRIKETKLLLTIKKTGAKLKQLKPLAVGAGDRCRFQLKLSVLKQNAVTYNTGATETMQNRTSLQIKNCALLLQVCFTLGH